MSGFTTTSRWRRVRLEVLERDHYICQVRGPKCTIQASEVDHIVPVEDGGDVYDPAGLRAACHWCNSWRAAKQKAISGWRRSQTHIILVTGPEYGGQREYVTENAGPHDLIVDYGTLADAMRGASPAEVGAARNALIRRIERGEVAARRAWITSANPKAEEMFPHHEVIRLGEVPAGGRREW